MSDDETVSIPKPIQKPKKPKKYKNSKKTTYEESKFKCTFRGCKKYFPSDTTLQYHLNKHNSIRPFKCNNRRCNKLFYSPWNRRYHMKHVCNY
jgi:hypothetical protein